MKCKGHMVNAKDDFDAEMLDFFDYHTLYFEADILPQV